MSQQSAAEYWAQLYAEADIDHRVGAARAAELKPRDAACDVEAGLDDVYRRAGLTRGGA